MAGNIYTYVSDAKLLYYTQKLKEKIPTAASFIDDTLSAVDKTYSSQKIDELIKNAGEAVIDDTSTDGTKVTWSAQKIYEEISKITGIEFKKVPAIPTEEGRTGTIYLVPNSGNLPNVYDEYIWVSDALAFTVETSTTDATVAIDSDVAKTKITEAGTTVFTYNGTDWADADGNTVTLADYGITYTDTNSNLATSDTITVTAKDGDYEKIGTTEIDLSGYVQATEMAEITTAQIDTVINTVWPTSTSI